MGGIIGGGHRVINARTSERTNEHTNAQREMKGQLAQLPNVFIKIIKTDFFA